MLGVLRSTGSHEDLLVRAFTSPKPGLNQSLQAFQHNIQSMSHRLSLVADDGEALYGWSNGQGTPIVLLHGWTASHASWAPLIEPLSRKHLLLRPDARGHGGHRLAVTPTPDVARLARDLQNWLDDCAIDKAIVVGHSMGALTLWQFIADYGTARLQKVCFIDQSPRLLTDANWDKGIYGDFDATRSARLLDELHADFAEGVLRLIAQGCNAKARQTYLANTSGWRKSRDDLRAQEPGPLIAIWQSLLAADYRPVLGRIDVPTLLVHGGASNFYSQATAHFLAAQIPSARLHIYAEADHCPQLVAPERFLADFTEFVNAA
jgi:pimeloyl-ACP methyl ester carboxylesterase